jgi:hypothetical protein
MCSPAWTSAHLPFIARRSNGRTPAQPPANACNYAGHRATIQINVGISASPTVIVLRSKMAPCLFTERFAIHFFFQLALRTKDAFSRLTTTFAAPRIAILATFVPDAKPNLIVIPAPRARQVSSLPLANGQMTNLPSATI